MESRKNICLGTKNSNERCNYKSKFDNYCGYHKNCSLCLECNEFRVAKKIKQCWKCSETENQVDIVIKEQKSFNGYFGLDYWNIIIKYCY
uniref:Uncharacterized protein n=1 Tax=Pithovirus LCDPAC02 TaxID=2506601 RepID=A0A481YPS7_9VIRU|nr:MAG: hypothetical protein LCDPAC02_02880 [Pithovirus LCDPAC02]